MVSFLQVLCHSAESVTICHQSLFEVSVPHHEKHKAPRGALPRQMLMVGFGWGSDDSLNIS